MPNFNTTSRSAINAANASTLRDCFSAELLKRIRVEGRSRGAATATGGGSAGKRRQRQQRQQQRTRDGNVRGTSRRDSKMDSPRAAADGDADGDGEEDDLAEFIDYLSQELFDALPAPIQSLSYSAVQNDKVLAEQVSPLNAHLYAAETLLPQLPPSVIEGLTAYELLPAERTSVANVLTATLEAFLASVTAAPPVWSSTRADTEGCEICGRDWLPLTYHHLIPKSTHERVLKRGWHEEWTLNSVAWLCRACHSYVHSIESNETLAKEFFTVERLLERDDVIRWAAWARKVRWKAS